MNYQKHYELLCNRAKNRQLGCYTENHHIVPRCLDGDDSPENIVALTPEEHYVAHQLLVKMYPQYSKLIRAARMMALNSNGNRGQNKLYGWLRKKHAKEIKDYWTIEKRKQQSIRSKNQWKNPEARARKSKQMTKKTTEYFESNPEARKRVSERNKDYWNDENNRARYSKQMEEYWADPDIRKQKSDQMKDFYEKNPEARNKLSQQRKGKKWYHDPDTGQSIMRFPNDVPDGFIPGRKFREKV